MNGNAEKGKWKRSLSCQHDGVSSGKEKTLKEVFTLKYPKRQHQQTSIHVDFERFSNIVNSEYQNKISFEESTPARWKMLVSLPWVRIYEQANKTLSPVPSMLLSSPPLRKGLEGWKEEEEEDDAAADTLKRQGAYRVGDCWDSGGLGTKQRHLGKDWNLSAGGERKKSWEVTKTSKTTGNMTPTMSLDSVKRRHDCTERRSVFNSYRNPIKGCAVRATLNDISELPHYYSSQGGTLQTPQRWGGVDRSTGAGESWVPAMALG